MKSGVSTTGLDEHVEMFNGLDQELKTKIVRSAVRDATNVITAAVQAATPVNSDDLASGTSLPPGAMKSDVHTRMSRQPEPGTQAGLCEFGKLTYWVARLVEYGHKNIKGGKANSGGKEIGFVPAHPFIRPAFEASAAAAQEQFRESMDRGINAYLKGK